MTRLISIFIVYSLSMLMYNCNGDSVVTTTEPPPYDIASFSRGGMMFDKFWSTEAGFNQNDTNILLFDSKPEFFRCKQCHGWDNLGRFGSYIGRGPNANRPNVAGLNLYSIIQTKSPQELFNTMNSTSNRRSINFDFGAYVPADPNDSAHKMPYYGQILTASQMWDLVKFMKEGILDVSELYNASYTGIYPSGSASYFNIGKDGSSSEGSMYYLSECSACHGINGTAILIENMTAGQFARTNPFEVQHKVRYGQLGTSMTGKFEISLNKLKNLFRALSDTSVFPNHWE